MYLIDVCFTPRKGVTASEFIQKFFSSEPVAGGEDAGEVFRPKFPVLFKEHPLRRGKNGLLVCRITFQLSSFYLPDYSVGDFCRAIRLFFKDEGAHLRAFGTEYAVKTFCFANGQAAKKQAAEAHG